METIPFTKRDLTVEWLCRNSFSRRLFRARLLQFLTLSSLFFWANSFAIGSITPGSGSETLIGRKGIGVVGTEAVRAEAVGSEILRTGPLLAGPLDSASSRRGAIRLLATIRRLDSSSYWPHVRPALFLENLRNNIEHPLSIYQGVNTNFCGYAAMTFLPLHDDPMGWLVFMLALYRDGQATLNGIRFQPSREIHAAAGTLVFKGVLDIRPADQLWFLLLADHFRGYLNIFTPTFHDGSEDTFWAAVNFAKFNRMVRKLCGYRVHARGSDLFRPSIHDLYDYIYKSMQTGITFLYVDNTYLHKKNHLKLKLHIPTHYLVLTDFRREPGPDGLITITYWDYGGKSLRQISEAFLKKIVYGVVHCEKADQPGKAE